MKKDTDQYQCLKPFFFFYTSMNSQPVSKNNGDHVILFCHNKSLRVSRSLRGKWK